MPKFIPGLKLCELFYKSQVRPILDKEFPNLRYSAAVIGWGSEVLEFGDELGSQVVAARLVREIMKLAFLMEKKYAPYSKWLGTTDNCSSTSVLSTS